MRKLTGQFYIKFFFYTVLQLVKILLHRAVLHDIIHILCRSRVEISLEPCYTRTARCKILIRNIVLRVIKYIAIRILDKSFLAQL